MEILAFILIAFIWAAFLLPSFFESRRRAPINATRDFARSTALLASVATVPEMLQSDLDYEYKVVGDLKAAIAICETEQDYQTRDLLRQMLADTEEDHAYWLEKQLGLIKMIGLENYLQSQM